MTGYLDGNPPRAFAHRGWHTGELTGLENTMAAFRRAVDEGYRYLETDVRVTADGHLVVFHDARLDRVTDARGAVGELPWSRIAEVEVGGRERIPQLSDLLEEFPEARFNIDAKTDAAVGPLADTIRRCDARDRVCVVSFSDRRLAALRSAVGPTVAWALGPRQTFTLFRASVARRPFSTSAVAAQVPIAYRRVQIVTPRFLKAAHDAGVEVHVWTIDDPAEMHRLLDLGVDGIMTDRPDVLREVVSRRAAGGEATAGAARVLTMREARDDAPSGTPPPTMTRPITAGRLGSGATAVDDSFALSAVPAAGSGRRRFARGAVKFFHGPMDCGKSTLALQLHYNHSRQGRFGLLLTKLDRSGPATISSRIGITSPAVEVGDEQDVRDLVTAQWARGIGVDYLIVDEAQFFTPAQIEQLATLADDAQVDVYAFGIATDFRGRLFPGSARLFELADDVSPLQVEVLCWCGRIGRFNARVVDDLIVREGVTVMVADTGPDAPGDHRVRYQVLCRAHHRSGTLGPEPASGGITDPERDEPRRGSPDGE